MRSLTPTGYDGYIGNGKIPIRSGAGLLIGFIIIRSAFLGTMENPGTAYVLECFPVILRKPMLFYKNTLPDIIKQSSVSFERSKPNETHEAISATAIM